MSSRDPHPIERPHRQYCFADFTLDLEGGFLRRGGEEVTLRPKAFEVLAYLVEHHGRLVTKTALTDAVWPDAAITDNSLAQCLVEIRRALDDDAQQLIRTMARRGYLFAAPVTSPIVEFPRQPVVAPSEPPGGVSGKPRNRSIVAGAFVLLAIAACAAYFFLRPRVETSGSAKDISFMKLTDQAGPETFPSLSPDGKSFVYAGRVSGNWDIYLQRVGGKNPVNLTKDSTADDTQPAFSPDGELIAFRSARNGGGIFVMGATGESVRRLTDFGYNPAWSPDGKYIVFGAALADGPPDRFAFDSQLWIVNASSGEKRQLTKPGVQLDAVQPNWSPHGHRIACWPFTAVSATSGPCPPTARIRSRSLRTPLWTGARVVSGRQLLYFASDRSGSMNLRRVRIDEKSGRVLGRLEAITTPSPYSGPISISRDRRRIAYVEQLTTANIQKVGFDPIKESLVSPPQWITQGSRQARYPDLSPDGEWLAFHDEGQQEDIFVVKTDGTGLRQLTNDVYKDRCPRWSPDGRRIAFHSNRGGKYDIWLINSDGSGLERLTYAPAAAVYFPVWSTDGKSLVYSIQDASPFVMEVAKPSKEQSPKPVVVPSGLGPRFNVRSWSPDGRKLAGDLRKADFSVSGLGVYSVESERLERLADFGGGSWWLGDSRRLMFVDQGKLYLIDSQSRKTREILSVAPHNISGSPALSRDDRMVYSSVVVREADIWLATLE